MTRAHYLRMAITCGLSAREAMMENTGLVQDMFELYIRSSRKEEQHGDTDD